MGALSSPVTAGHTGFTGTSIVIDPLAHSFVILLTNRVHPTRNWGNNNPSRAAVASDLALALPVRPTQGHTALVRRDRRQHDGDAHDPRRRAGWRRDADV